MATNFNSSPDSSDASDTKNFESAMPYAPHQTALPRGGPPMPAPARQLSPQEMKREMEILDRRRNWVFMTPEEMMGGESSSDSSDKGGKTDSDKGSASAMQRYYERLYDADHQAPTNQLSKFDPDSWTRTTNSALGAGSQSGLSPFDASADSGVFQPGAVRADGFSAIFGSGGNAGGNAALLSPEQVRSQEEQKVHMDDFKQMWGIDQPPPAVANAITAPPPVPVKASAPEFGSIQGSTPARIVDLSSPGSIVQPTATPPPSTLTSSRSVAPPHSDFAPPQRPF